ncbi:MAG TPA: hypothetical protein VF891_00120 [Gaiellaceae bacterium]
MSLRRAPSFLCLALCATALVGCGGDTFAFDPVANAATKTADSTSARVDFTASMTLGSMGTMSFAGRGLFDGQSKSGWMNMTFSLPPAAQAQLGANPTMEMIFDGRDGFVVYMRSSMFPGLPAGSWVKMDLAKLADKQGVDLGGLTNANQADPSQTLRMLMASSDSRVLNYDRVRGVLTTHYALRVDLKRLAKDNKDLREALEKVIEVTGVDSYPAEAWIDSQGRVRRIKVDISLGAQLGTPMTMTMTEDLYDFGVRTNIAPPPENQVVDVSKLVGG